MDQDHWKEDMGQQIDAYLTQLKAFFISSRPQCLTRVTQLVELYPRNHNLIQIKAACQSLLGNHQTAIKDYQDCIKLNPNSLAYTNNIAWNYIKLGNDLSALMIISKIKQLWHHPAIYWQFLKLCQSNGSFKQNQEAYKQAEIKLEQNRDKYPTLLDEINQGLIHTFLLPQKHVYNGKVKQFEEQMEELVKALRLVQSHPFNFQKYAKLLQEHNEKIQFRKTQQKQSGIVIDNKLKAHIEAIECFKKVTTNAYHPQHQLRSDKFVKNVVKTLNQYVFNQQIQLNVSYSQIEKNMLQPMKFRLQQLRSEMLQFVHLSELDRNFINQQRIRVDRYERPQYQPTEIEFVTRLEDMEKIIELNKQRISILKVQRNSENPLLIYTQSTTQKNEVFNAFINIKKLNNNCQYLSISEELQKQLQQQPPSLLKASTIKRYGFVLNLLFYFYNNYYTNNYSYRVGNEQQELNVNKYIQMLTPILNQLGDQNVQSSNVGYLCNQVHYSLLKFINEVRRSQQYWPIFKNLLKIIHRVVEHQDGDAANKLILWLLTQNESHFLQKILAQHHQDSSQTKKYREYFNWKMNRHHKLHGNQGYQRQFQKEDDLIIQHVTLLFLTMVFCEQVQGKDGVMVEAFIQCYSRFALRNPFEEKLLKQYYDANHDISNLRKVGEICKTILKKLFC